MTEPLNWPALVAETLRRRKQEGLTQQQHAALANVSRPTILAFDKGETSLSLAKAFDILRVVGLLAPTPSNDAQDRFVAESFARWHRHLADLPPDSPARFPYGYCAVAYCFEGDFPKLEEKQLLRLMREAYRSDSLWSVFQSRLEGPFAPKFIEKGYEWWQEQHKPKNNAASFAMKEGDFWRATALGKFFHLRGYAEDQPHLDREGNISNISYSIYNTCAVWDHVSALGTMLLEGKNAELRLRMRFTGLLKRILVGRRFPDVALPNFGKQAMSDEIILELRMPFTAFKVGYETDLPGQLAAFMAPLGQAFGDSKLTAEYIAANLKD